MAETWMLEDDFDTVSEHNSVCSNKWKRNTALEAEAMVVLDYVQKVVQNMRNSNEGTLKMHLDCKLV